MGLDTLLVTILVFILSIGLTWWISRRHSSSQDIIIDLQKTTTITPKLYGLEGHLKLLYNFHGVDRPIEALCVYDLTIRNKGNRDLNEDQNAIVSNPRIDLSKGKAIGVRTVEMDNSLFYVPIARGNSDASVHVNFGRIKAGKTASFMVMCIPDTVNTEIEFSLYPAFIPNFNIKPSGLIAERILTR